ncbi:transposase [Streptomyces pimonensis]|uniref:Transposase n=1 Tax=Streptomyces pimonensis TaxID=2860288 RepID=A0ABV4J563_9ACTN
MLFEDEAGFSMTPPTSRTWARRGHTPVIRVRGRSQRRFPIAALARCKQGERSRLVFRPKRHIDHKRGGRRSFTWTDYRDLLTAAHQQLDAPFVLIRDNLNVHLDTRLRAFTDTHDWITAYQLPPYAPDLNPVEGIWSPVRRTGRNNTAFTDPDHLMHVPRRTLRELQYRSETIDGCLAATGPTLTTSRRQAQ